MKKILITGVAGFIGSQIARRFIEEGYFVIGVDDLSGGYIENVPPEADFIQGDLALTETMQHIPPDCAQILHLAGQSSGEISFDDPVADLQKNTISTLNLINYGIENQVERLVYASSMSVYGSVADEPIAEKTASKPLSCYGVSKLAAEGYLRIYSYQLPYVAMRMFNVYGPGQDMKNLRQGMVSIFLSQALDNGEILVKGGLNRFRDFIYIDDVVEAWFRASTCTDAKNQIINVGTGVRTTVGSLLDLICGLIPESHYSEESGTPGDQNGIYADTRQLNQILGRSEFISLQEGLSRFLAWASKS